MYFVQRCELNSTFCIVILSWLTNHSICSTTSYGVENCTDVQIGFSRIASDFVEINILKSACLHTNLICSIKAVCIENNRIVEISTL